MKIDLREKEIMNLNELEDEVCIGFFKIVFFSGDLLFRRKRKQEFWGDKLVCFEVRKGIGGEE